MCLVRPGTTHTFSPNAMTWKERNPRLPARAILPLQKPFATRPRGNLSTVPARPVYHDTARHLSPQAVGLFLNPGGSAGVVNADSPFEVEALAASCSGGVSRARFTLMLGA